MAKELDDSLEPGGNEEAPASGRRLAALSLTALGVVYGDIGTSPLYALRECFRTISPSQANVLGVLSTIFWSLVLVISIKYLLYVLRASNRGEGGILALMALLHPSDIQERIGATVSRARTAVVAIGLFGAALLYADGTITPAISVLSAVEGLTVATPTFENWVLPISCGILLGLFFFQRRGTGSVGRVFGSVMTLWFSTIGVLGLMAIAARPETLSSVDPRHAFSFFADHGLGSLAVLASVFLVVTGGEALYADLGHFGARPIRVAWFTLVLPALLLNYFGQGALLLTDPDALVNPFYRLAPDWALYPLVGIATAATVIASQAVISGAFSLTRQAIQLGYLPRMRIEHTSARHLGQVFVPGVNRALLVVTIGLCLLFQHSSALAAAYGVAVSTTMVITTLLVAWVAIEDWGWNPWWTGAISAGMLCVDLTFFAANLVKIPTGGWLPLSMAGALFLAMSTWKRGNAVLEERLKETRRPLETLLEELEKDPPQRMQGTAVVLTESRHGTPAALLHQLELNRMLHEQVIVLTLRAAPVPYLPTQVEIEELPLGFYRVMARHGFMQTTRIRAVLERCREQGIDLEVDQAIFLLSRQAAVARETIGMPQWRGSLYALMQRNALPPSDYLALPHGKVIELGVEVEV